MNRSNFVGTGLGVFAQRVREQAEILHSALFTPERVGTNANDRMARLLLERLCPEGGRFLDVGAHIGSVIDGVGRHSKPAEIYAVEAIPAKVEKLRKRFPAITLFDCAVGDADGEVGFFVDVEQSGYSSLNQPIGGSGKVREIRVPIRRLDDLLPIETIDVIKIDVEGAELGVLRGAEALIARSRPVIMFESGPDNSGPYSKRDLWRWLDAAGYAVLVPNRVAHNDEGLSEDGFVEAHRYPPRTTNYFAVARDRQAAVRLRARALLGFKH